MFKSQIGSIATITKCENLHSEFCWILFKKNLKDISPFIGRPLIPLFWASGDVWPGFQNQGDSSLAYFLTCVQQISQIHI